MRAITMRSYRVGSFEFPMGLHGFFGKSVVMCDAVGLEWGA